MGKAYEPKGVEDAIYAAWLESGYFNPDNLPGDRREAFSIVLPPPNVTGTLHMGHASMLAIQDAMIRFARLQGKKTLWLPGTDHAAIATQSKVEKIIKESEKKSRHDLGREAFLDRVRAFAQESHDTIVNQVKKMGSSVDWSREAYTLDDVRNKAVNTAFKRMYDDGLIYRGNRMVNWDPKGQTTISDDEMVYVEEKTKFYYFKYGPFVIGTARPETKFGDKYVVMHPDDARYASYKHGDKLHLEWINGPIEATIIKDTAIDPEFGTGVMTITPWHSAVDFDIAQRHDLDKEQIIDEQGVLLPVAGEFAGMHIKDARPRIVEKLRSKGLLAKEEDYTHQIATAERTGEIIEPQIKLQWFIDVNKEFERDGKMVTLKLLMQNAVRSKAIDILPDRFEKTYFHWIDNLRDWCISRQIWFGHRIPVWYKVIPAFADLENLLEEKKEMQVGEEGSVVHAKKGEEYRYILESSEDFAWVKQNVSVERTFAYADFFDGTTRIRVDEDSFVKSEKETSKQGVVAKRGKGGTWNGVLVSFEERCTQGFARYEIEFKGEPPDSFKNKKRITSTDILNYQQDESEAQSILAGSAPYFAEDWTQDEDTLDTWFSSGLWTFSTLGWPIEQKLGFNASLLELVKTGEKTLTYRLKNKGFVIGETVVAEDTQSGKPFGYITIKGILKKKIKDIPCPEKGSEYFSSTEELIKTQKKYYPEEQIDEETELYVYKFCYSEKPDLELYHPTSVLETGYDILFFWVARMILMSTYLVNDVPFKTVYLHGLVRDEQGRKMSKSLGNIIDPLTMIEKYGADATRLSLVLGNTPGNDLKLSEEKIAGFRNFTNKLWNISRFVLGGVSEVRHTPLPTPHTLADKWILSRFATVVGKVTKLHESYDLSLAGEILRDFTWGEFADWYLEIAKAEGKPEGEGLPSLQAKKDDILLFILERLLILWHPFMPFVTEEIYKQWKSGLIIVAEWPKADDLKHLVNESAEKQFAEVQEVIVAIRNIRAQYKVDQKATVNVFVETPFMASLSADKTMIEKMARVTIESVDVIPSEGVAKAVVGSMTIAMPLAGMVDVAKERERLEKEIASVEKFVTQLSAKLENAEFVARAPEHVIAQEKQKLADAQARHDALRRELKSVGE